MGIVYFVGDRRADDRANCNGADSVPIDEAGSLAEAVVGSRAGRRRAGAKPFGLIVEQQWP